MLFTEVLQSDGHRKAPVGANLHRVKSGCFLCSLNQCDTGIVLIRQLVSQHRHARKAFRGMGVGFQRLHILLNRLDAALQLFNLLQEALSGGYKFVVNLTPP